MTATATNRIHGRDANGALWIIYQALDARSGHEPGRRYARPVGDFGPTPKINGYPTTAEAAQAVNILL